MTSIQDMDKYEVPFIYGETLPDARIEVSVPGSKSITNRSLLIATLADGTSLLKGVLFSDDSRHFMQCLRDLGFNAEINEANRAIKVTGIGGAVPKSKTSINVGSAGTAARFLTAYLGVSQGEYFLDSSDQMKKRPMSPLLNSLKELGCEISHTMEEGHFPFKLAGHGFRKNEISIDIEHSSQFLSALLISSCLSSDDFTIKVIGHHGMAYIDMTIKMMGQFGVRAKKISDDAFLIEKGQKYHALEYQIEPDVSAACYFYACTPLLGIPSLVKNVHFESMQGDIQFIKTLEQMGCKAKDTEDGILLTPPENGKYQGVTVDMSSFSDQAITLAAIAVFAETPTTITGIRHIRFQESNRIEAIVTELSKMGIKCVDSEDSITIYPGKPSGSLVNTYDDHRMAMGFSLIGLRAKNIVIDDPMCCRKTFENYFSVLGDMVNSIH